MIKVDRAFLIGYIYGRRRDRAADDAKWITVHPGGKGPKVGGGTKGGVPVLIDGATGRVLAGMGGKHTGKTMAQVKQESKAGRSRATSGGATGQPGRKPDNKKPPEFQLEPLRRPPHMTDLIKPLPLEPEPPKKSKPGIDLTAPAELDSRTVLQNRNRAGIGSIRQIQNIANHPQYMMMSGSKMLSDGAPVISYGNYDNAAMGRVTQAISADGTRYDVQYAVVDADDVLTSHDAMGMENPDYLSADTSRKRAIAGNGRLAAMQLSYRNGRAGDYRQELLADNSLGLDPDEVRKIKHPVLVRVMQPKDITADIGDKTNTQQGMRMNAVEQANNDAKRVDLTQVQTDDNGEPTMESIRDFIGRMPIAEQNELIDPESGDVSKQAVWRMQAAVFAKAYGSDDLTRKFSLQIDPDSKNILNALNMAAPAMAALADLPEGYDVRDIVANAASQAVRANKNKQKLIDLANTPDLFADKGDDAAARAIIRVFAKNIRSAAAMRDKLVAMAEKLKQEAVRPRQDMFGVVPHKSRQEVVAETLSQDARPARMSPAARAYWSKYGGRYLTLCFDGKPTGDEFFAGLHRVLAGG